MAIGVSHWTLRTITVLQKNLKLRIQKEYRNFRALLLCWMLTPGPTWTECCNLWDCWAIMCCPSQVALGDNLISPLDFTSDPISLGSPCSKTNHTWARVYLHDVENSKQSLLEKHFMQHDILPRLKMSSS